MDLIEVHLMQLTNPRLFAKILAKKAKFLKIFFFAF